MLKEFQSNEMLKEFQCTESKDEWVWNDREPRKFEKTGVNYIRYKTKYTVTSAIGVVSSQ